MLSCYLQINAEVEQTSAELSEVERLPAVLVAAKLRSLRVAADEKTAKLQELKEQITIAEQALSLL